VPVGRESATSRESQNMSSTAKANSNRAGVTLANNQKQFVVFGAGPIHQSMTPMHASESIATKVIEWIHTR